MQLFNIQAFSNILRTLMRNPKSTGSWLVALVVLGSMALQTQFVQAKLSSFGQASESVAKGETKADVKTDMPSAAKLDSKIDKNSIAQSALPPNAQKTLALIFQGGPFPYQDKDGSTFGNREGVLPKQARGYYSEYTVKTPGAKNRGALRIIAGKGKTGDPATSGEYYYTADHYESFQRIVLNK